MIKENHFMKNRYPIYSQYSIDPPINLIKYAEKKCSFFRLSLCLSIFASIGLAPSLAYAGEISSDYTVNAFKADDAPSVSNDDLAQTSYSSSSHATLFNGRIGSGDSDKNDEDSVQIDDSSSITIDFDLKDNASGFDIWGINSFFGWNPTQGGRSNQGYSVTFSYVDGSKKTIDAQHWEPNSPSSYWTVVSFESGASGSIASGVKSITFDISEEANAGGWVVAREIDIFNSPTEAGYVGYSIALQAPDGTNIPKIVGASGNTQMLTGYDYFNWFGITEHRSWFKPSFPSLPDNSSVNSERDFIAASEAIRKDPMRQATSNDYFIDWDYFYNEVEHDEITEHIDHLRARDIMPMIVNSNFVDDIDAWDDKLAYWKQWYTMVYYLASEYDITMYQMRNEPNHNDADYTQWETHWLTSADAMRKAIDDVNRDFGKSLALNLAGPVTPGVYWDYELPHPDEDIHSWGNVSWEKVKYDLFNDYDVNNPFNYNSYDYHRYGLPASRTESIMLDGRLGLKNATNDPKPDIPMVISEFNTNTGGSFDKIEADTEDLRHGVSMAAILEAVSVHGEDGLGDEGGFFIFKLGASQSESIPLVGVGNKLSYVSREEPENYGGITRGGATFQMFAHHFRGGKPIVPVETLVGDINGQRTMAAFDEENGMYYIYGSVTEGAGTSISINLDALDIARGDTATLQRVDEFNTGQITEILTVSDANDLSFYAPDNTAFLIKLPLAGSLSDKSELAPSDDMTKAVIENNNQGSASTMIVSNHHSNADERNVALIRFTGDYDSSKQALLKISGRNIGNDKSEREILHVYAVNNASWSEDASMSWENAPGLGRYFIDETKMGTTDGTGDMIDIEDNYGGHSNGAGKGLGLSGEFLGAVSFHSSDYVDNYLDVTEYLNEIDNDNANLDVTFVVVRIVRYNVNEYANEYYHLGDYHYDGREVEIASKENSDKSLRPSLLFSALTTGPDNGPVDPVDEIAPTVSFDTPESNSMLGEDESLLVNVNADDADGDIVSVSLSVDGTFVRTEKRDPYEWGVKDTALQNLSSGTHTLTAVATDNDGLSTEVNISVVIGEEVVEPPSEGNKLVHIVKNNQNFAIDGDKEGANRQNVYLYDSKQSNVNQQWIELDRGNGFYSYQKNGTKFCLDGGSGGKNGQTVYLYKCIDDEQNQHWRKVDSDSGSFRLEKRNAPGFSIDGGNDGSARQDVKLWSSDNDNENQQWNFTTLD